MKKTLLFVVSFTILAVSCQKEKDAKTETPAERRVEYRTVSCSLESPDSKVAIANDGKTTWVKGDKILIHGEYMGFHDSDGDSVEELYSTVVTLNTENISADGKTATFTMEVIVPYDKSASGYKSTMYAAYPADAVSNDTHCSYYNKFNNTNLPLMSGYNDNGGDSFTFHNLCAVISFVVDSGLDADSYVFYGNSGETVGYSYYQTKVTDPAITYNYATGSALTSISGSLTDDGVTTNCIYIPNGVTFTKGFTIELYKNNSLVKMASTKGSIELTRNMLLPLGNISTRLRAADLSKKESANCYVVSYPSTYKFKTVQGNSDTSVGTVASASLIWETYNNASTVVEKSVISSVSYADGYISFTLPDPVQPGNALIAALDASDNILWSWHIWIPETAITTGTYGISTPEMMDRNLGALVPATVGASPVDIRSGGLFYQWGRKDPFLPAKSWSSSSFATCAGTAPSAVSGQKTIAETISAPTVFACGSENWLSSSDPNYETQKASLWTSSKTIYDPCPSGYKVPLRTDCSFFTSYSPVYTNDFSTTYTTTYGSAVFANIGRLYYSDGSVSGTKKRILVWSATSDSDTKSRAVYVYTSGNPEEQTYSLSAVQKANGASVRCVRE